MSTILGTTLSGRYRLDARIGSGGMSTVYRALDATLQRQVAIKLMNREVATDSDQLERFRREARAVAQLSHPHVVNVIDAGEDEGRPYIVFEYVEGETQVAVAMKHVREQLPDVQAKRPEVSAALAAVVETATAKRQEERYVNDAELIADLEDVLAIETARSGSATGEVTTVLRTLPSRTQRRVPLTIRHRAWAVIGILIAAALTVGAIVWLGTRTHHGTSRL